LTPTATGATWNTSGEFIHAAYTQRKDHADFGQAGTVAREVMDWAQRDRLESNVAGHINSNRVLKNNYQAVSQGVRRFGKRSIFIHMCASTKASQRRITTLDTVFRHPAKIRSADRCSWAQRKLLLDSHTETT
jgi:chromosome condensin MukBEF MukE localization factor